MFPISEPELKVPQRDDAFFADISHQLERGKAFR